MEPASVVSSFTSCKWIQPVDGYHTDLFATWWQWQRLFLCAASILSNLFVFTYHLVERPHPKFLVHFRRKLTVRVHVACGGLEMLCAILAFCTARPVFAIFVSCFSFGHVATSCYLLTGVFGIRVIMMPSYFWVIVLHLLNGIRLLLHLDSASILIDTFLTLQIYVWVRVAYSFIDSFPTMMKYQYTISVLMAGMIILPSCTPVFGLAGNLAPVVFIALWNMLRGRLPPCCSHAYPSYDEDAGDYRFDKTELGRTQVRYTTHRKEELEADDIFVAKSYSRLMSNTTPAPGVTPLSLNACETPNVMRFYSTLADQSGEVDVHEEKPFSMIKLRHTSHTPTPPQDADDGPLRRHESFRKYVFSPSGHDAGEDFKATQLEVTRSGAFHVFENLCTDTTVGFTKDDAARLLAVWGLPHREVEYVFGERVSRLADPEVFSFEEFYELLEPVWRYSLEMMEVYGTQREAALHLRIQAQATICTPSPHAP